MLQEEQRELLALDLRKALEQLGEMVGAVYTEDLLDRVSAAFYRQVIAVVLRLLLSRGLLFPGLWGGHWVKV